MPSLRSSLFILILKYRNMFRFKLGRKPTVDWNTSIAQLRLKTGKPSGFFGKLPDDLEVENVAIGAIPADRLHLPGAAKDRIILYFHGGCYAIGSKLGHRPVVAKFVRGSGVDALVFDYRLAPEYPFPAAFDDALASYCWLLASGMSPANIVFVGDSAGGGLCLATLLALRERGIPLPAAAAVLSPWTDLKNTGESLQTNRKVDVLTWAESWTVFSKYYAADNDPGLPWISPLYGDLRGLPPLLINVGGYELLRDDSTRFAEKAKDAGVNVTLRIGKGMFHCYPVCAPLFPEATHAMAEICDFIKVHVSKG